MNGNVKVTAALISFMSSHEIQTTYWYLAVKKHKSEAGQCVPYFIASTNRVSI